MNDYFQFLRDIPFFSSLSDSDIRKIQNVCQEKHFEAGEVVFAENSLGDNFFIILNGSIEIWKGYKNQNQNPLAIFGQGQLFGELALIDDFPRSATVIAREPSKMLSIHREDFLRIITESGSISLSIMKSISAMLRESTRNFLEDLKARNRYLEKAYSRLKKSDEQRVASLKQKEMLLRQIHHRVRNNMEIITSLLNFQSRRLKDNQSIEIFHETQSRIKVMILIHETLFQSPDVSKINAESYLNKLSKMLFQTFRAKHQQICLSVESTEELFLALDDAVPVGLVIYELVSNAFKYAFPDNRNGEIKIILGSKSEEIELLVSDDGTGFPLETGFFNDTEKLGLVLVKGLVEDQLEGSLQFSQDQGTQFTIRFKPKRVTE